MRAYASRPASNRAASASADRHATSLRSFGVQAKLTVGAPGDVYEQEAEQVAERVMRMPEPKVQRACGGTCDHCRAKESEEETVQTRRLPGVQQGPETAPPSVQEALRSPSRPLDPASATFFSSRFGHDFRNVRVHAGPEAARSTQELQASAFTVGRDIVFAPGQYAPGSENGRRLLAHELTHVVQQGSAIIHGAPVLTDQRNLSSRVAPMIQRQQAPEAEGVDIITGVGQTHHFGGIRFANQTARDDVLRNEQLLGPVDLAHVTLQTDGTIGYDMDYLEPEDPFRFKGIRQLVDSHERVDVQAVSSSTPIQKRPVPIGGQAQGVVTTTLANEGAEGITFFTKDLLQKSRSVAASMSPDPSKSMVFYTQRSIYSPLVGMGNQMAHELLGHVWLAVQGLPSQHKGSLAATTGAEGPFAPSLTDPSSAHEKIKPEVDTFISALVGTQSVGTTGVVSSTHRVGLRFLKQGLEYFTARGTAELDTMAQTGLLTPDWRANWALVARQHDLLMKTRTILPDLLAIWMVQWHDFALDTPLRQATFRRAVSARAGVFSGLGSFDDLAIRVHKTFSTRPHP